MSLSPYLRASLQSLRLTRLSTGYNIGTEGAIVIGPRLAWAAELTEFERVQVRAANRPGRHPAYIIFGEEGKVEWWCPGGSDLRVGDRLNVSAHAWRNPADKTEAVASVVEVNVHNAPIEIRRVTPRRVLYDPGLAPLPPRQEKILLESAVH